MLTKCFQAGSLVTVKAPPPFCSVIPPLPSSASHCSFLRWENSCWNIHGGFELGNCSGKAVISKTRRRIFSYVLPHIVQVCARSNGSWHDQRCIVVNYPNSSGVEWHSTRQKCARRRRCGHAELPKYTVYPWIATLFTLKPMCCCYKQYLVTLSHVVGNVVTISCVKKNCYGKGEIEKFMEVSLSLVVLLLFLYQTLCCS